jgi:hypothetical protein
MSLSLKPRVLSNSAKQGLLGAEVTLPRGEIRDAGGRLGV